MKGEIFEIWVSRFRMQAEIIYQSEQVMRFKISGGKRCIVLEKLLKKKTGQWKLKEGDIDFSKNIKDTAYNLMRIQDEIDYYLKKKK